LTLRLIPLETHVEVSQISAEVSRLIPEEVVVELEHTPRILTELVEIIDVFKEETLVEPRDEFIEEEFLHVGRHKLSIERDLLHVFAHTQVLVGCHAMVNHKQPHSSVFTRVKFHDRLRVICIELLHALIVEVGSMPNCFCVMTAE
jgi:hypothetical protein